MWTRKKRIPATSHLRVKGHSFSASQFPRTSFTGRPNPSISSSTEGETTSPRCQISSATEIAFSSPGGRRSCVSAMTAIFIPSRHLRNVHRELRNPRKNRLPSLSHSEKSPFRPAVRSDHVIGVVGKALPGLDPWELAHDTVTFHDDTLIPGIGDDPFATLDR